MLIFIHIIIEQVVITIDVSLTDTIAMVMKKIQEKQQILPTRKQKLVYKTADMEEDMRLSDYNIKETTVVILTLVPVENEIDKIVVERKGEFFYFRNNKSIKNIPKEKPYIVFFKKYFTCFFKGNRKEKGKEKGKEKEKKNVINLKNNRRNDTYGIREENVDIEPYVTISMKNNLFL